MLRSVSQGVFIVCFTVLSLLLCILGNTTQSYPYYGLIFLLISFLLAFQSHLDWQLVYKYKNIFILWFLFFIGLLISSYFTHSTPLTIEAWVSYTSLALFFTFFLLLSKSFVSSEILVFSTTIVLLVMVILSAAVLIIPSLGSLLPPMNLLYSTYGHNHINAVLLLFYPVVIWFFMKGNYKLGGAVVALFTAGIIFSFGRTVLFLAMLEVVTMLIASSFFNFKHDVQKATRLISICLLCLFGLVFLFLLYPSIKTVSSNTTYECSKTLPFKQLENFACKNILEEQRPFYWGQAVLSFNEYPLTGYGPGTFSLISAKYRQFPQLKTLFAHNAYLQNLAELGIFGGGTFIALLFYLLYFSWKNLLPFNQKNVSSNFKWPLLVGVVAMYINVFFDYDWQFTATLLLTFLSLAILLSDNNSSSVKKQIFLRPATVKIIFIATCAALLIYMAFAFYQSVALFRDTENSQQSFHPHLIGLARKYFTKDSLSEAQKNSLLDMYWNHSDMLVSAKSSLSDNQQTTLRSHLLEIDPWLYFDYPTPKNITGYENENIILQARLLLKMIEKTRFDQEWVREKLGITVFKIAQQAVLENKATIGLKLFGDSVELWPLNLHQRRLNLTLTQSTDDVCILLNRLLDYPVTDFGDNQRYYADAYLSCLENKRGLVDRNAVLTKVHQLDGVLAHQYWVTYSQRQTVAIKKSLKINDTEAAQLLAQDWYEFWKVTVAGDWQVHYSTSKSLATMLLEIGATDTRYSEENAVRAEEIITKITQ